MKVLSICLLASVYLLVSTASGQDRSQHQSTFNAQPQFLETGKWWNLYFAKGNDPLARGTTSINAVKIVQLNETHGSWVQIAFPKKQKEHFSIFGPAAKAHDDHSVDLESALAEWERSVTEWKVIWINLDFVVHISKVGPSHATEPAAEPVPSGDASPPAG